MIIEGLVTTVDSAGRVNLAPMGPIVTGDFQSLTLRPFQPSTTFTNLNAGRCGVFHVVDQVDIIARAAIGRLDSLPPMEPAERISGYVLVDCCRWFEFRVDEVDTTHARSVMPSTVVHRGERRAFLGLNRARHAVLEAAILATRLHLTSAEEVIQTIRMLEPGVLKTGDATERDAFDMIRQYISESGLGRNV